MRKQAQIQSQMFIYLLAILVIGLLLLFGTKSILRLFQQVDDVDFLTFKTEIEAAGSRIAPNYGTWEKFQLSVPAAVEKVCFIQHKAYPETAIFYKDQEGLCLFGDADYEFLVCDAWKEGVLHNVYPIPYADFQAGEGIYLGELEVKNAGKHYLCIPVFDRTLSVKMVGRGNRVLVEAAS